MLIHEGAYGVYINETNKDSDWKKYLDALDDMSNSKYIKDSRDELVKGSRENEKKGKWYEKRAQINIRCCIN